MKKMMFLSLSMLFLMAGCEDSKANQTVETKPVAEQALAKAAPAAPAPAAEAKAVEVVSIDWEKAIEMNKSGAVFVDVRTAAEVAEGMVPGALNIPLQEITHRSSELPKDKDLLIYCRSGKRSMAASNFLVNNGFDRVFNVNGGFLAYPKK